MLLVNNAVTMFMVNILIIHLTSLICRLLLVFVIIVVWHYSMLIKVLCVYSIVVVGNRSI
jgi:hypothetical protein